MRALGALLRIREAGILVMVALLFAVVGAIEPRFLSGESLRAILLAIPLIMVAAMGQMMVIVARHIDLSIGSIMAFAAIAVGMMFRDVPDFPLWLGFLMGIAVGGGLGLVNGLIVTLFALPSIIVTLGTMSLYRGLVFILSGGRQVDPNHIPEPLIRMAQTSPIDIPWIVLIAFAVAVAAHLFLRYARIGREIYAVGSNTPAARLRGIQVVPVTLLVFVLSGATAGLAGLMYAGRFGYVNPGITGIGFELTVIAAIVIGGVSINGGTGSVLGTALGVLLLGAVTVALPILGISGFWQGAIYGAIIVIALVIDRTVREGGVAGLTRRTV